MNTQGLISTHYSMVRFSTIIGILLGSVVLAIPTFSSAQSLVASVLPTSRSVQVGGTPATAFATIINADTNASATQCFIAPATTVAADFIYQTTDPDTNALIGTPDTPVDIPADSSQSFLIVFTPTSAFDPLDVELTFDCDNRDPVAVIPGVNTLLLSASTDPVPDIIAIARTLKNDGDAKVPGIGASAAFVVATFNVGAGDDTMFVTAQTSSPGVALNLFLCETDPITSVCTNPPSPGSEPLMTSIATNATPTFGVFATTTGAVPADAATNRIFVRFFQDIGGTIRGATSVAVQTLDITGMYEGSTTLNITGCEDPTDDGTFTFDDFYDVSTQTQDQFSGTSMSDNTFVVEGVPVTLETEFIGTLSPDVANDATVSGTSMANLFVDGELDTSVEPTFTGTLNGNTLSILSSGETPGDTCMFSAIFTGLR